MTPVFARLAFQREETADAVRRVAPGIGLLVRDEIDLTRASLEPSGCALLLLEQRDAPEALIPRMYSLAGAHPDVLVVPIVPAPRDDLDAGLLGAGAFDVVDDGPTLPAQLARTITAARRVIALQEERTRLSADLTQQDKLAALGLLAAGVSHEVNNPCGAILANMVALRDELRALMATPPALRLAALDERADEWRESTDDCVAAARRIHAIVKTLNVFSRRGDGATPQPIDVNDEIQTVLRLVGKEVRFQSRFDVALAPDLPPIVAPPNVLPQILTNLVVNALQALEHLPAGQRRITITSGFDAQCVVIEVADNGPGIAPDVVGRIFDPFFTTKPVGTGTGLGLAITRQLVRNAGGEIFVDSAPGRGARFRVIFERPVAPDVRSPARASVPPRSARLRVMIVEDDELTLRSIQRSLAAHFECVPVARAAEAFDSLRRDGRVDVVVSDIVMPEMNGLEFYQQLLVEHPALASRCAFVTGGITSEALRASVVATGRPLLSKPLDVGELIRTIRTLGETQVG